MQGRAAGVKAGLEDGTVLSAVEDMNDNDFAGPNLIANDETEPAETHLPFSFPAVDGPSGKRMLTESTHCVEDCAGGLGGGPR